MEIIFILRNYQGHDQPLIHQNLFYERKVKDYQGITLKTMDYSDFSQMTQDVKQILHTYGLFIDLFYKIMFNT